MNLPTHADSGKAYGRSCLQLQLLIILDADIWKSLSCRTAALQLHELKVKNVFKYFCELRA